MIALACALAIYSILQWWEYGTRWFDWDFMLVTGGLTFLVTVTLSMSFERRMDACIDQLRSRQVFWLTDQDFTSFRTFLNFSDGGPSAPHGSLLQPRLARSSYGPMPPHLSKEET